MHVQRLATRIICTPAGTSEGKIEGNTWTITPLVYIPRIVIHPLGASEEENVAVKVTITASVTVWLEDGKDLFSEVRCERAVRHRTYRDPTRTGERSHCSRRLLTIQAKTNHIVNSISLGVSKRKKNDGKLRLLSQTINSNEASFFNVDTLYKDAGKTLTLALVPRSRIGVISRQGQGLRFLG